MKTIILCKNTYENMDRAISGSSSLIILVVILVLFFATGIILFIAGGVQAAADSERRFPGLIGVGFGFITVGVFCCTVEGVIVRVRYHSRLKNAIAAESIKYSNRLPTPCSWRLHTTRLWNGRHDDNSHTKIHDYVSNIVSHRTVEMIVLKIFQIQFENLELKNGYDCLFIRNRTNLSRLDRMVNRSI